MRLLEEVRCMLMRGSWIAAKAICPSNNREPRSPSPPMCGDLGDARVDATLKVYLVPHVPRRHLVGLEYTILEVTCSFS